MAKIDLRNLKFQNIFQLRMTSLIVVIILLMGLITYLVYANYTVEQTKKFIQLQQEEISLRDELRQKYALVKSVPLYLAKTAALSALESNINSHFPNSDELPDVLILINQLAEDSRVTISSFTPDQMGGATAAAGNAKNKHSGPHLNTPGGKIQSQAFRLNISADYLDFIKFVYKIAQTPRVMEIVNIHMVRQDQNKINVSCDIIIFYSS